MIYINKEICNKCGICLKNFEGYCMNEVAGFPVVDTEICNQCQKCIAICPQRAISMNKTPPERIINGNRIGYDDLISLLRLRRSVKKFMDKKIPYDIVMKIADSAKYAPNQNKNIKILIVDDQPMIQAIDQHALEFINRIYRILFSNRLITAFIGLFAGSMEVIKKKMERDLNFNRRVVKTNTQVLLLTIGNPRIPVTEMSAQYLLATMNMTAVSLDIGSTLMDSLKISINRNRFLKSNLGLKKGDKVLGVLALGYSNEKILNIPLGYEVELYRNRMNVPYYGTER